MARVWRAFAHMVVLAVVLHTVVASGVQNLDLMDASQLRHVLKGGAPQWACHGAVVRGYRLDF